MQEKKYTHLLFGVGEVGQAIKKTLIKNCNLYWFDINPKIKNNLPTELSKVDVLHITFPQNPSFCEEVKKLIKKYSPELTVIHSTTIPGTTKSLGKKVVHSPVIGQHDQLYHHIKTFRKAIGPNDQESLKLAKKYLSKIYKLEFYTNSKTTEAGKVLSLAKFAINIEMARYSQSFCKSLKIDFKEASQKFTKLYNEGYEKNKLQKFIQPILEPPVGKIGGSCVLPGVQKAHSVLEFQFFDDILKQIEKNKST